MIVFLEITAILVALAGVLVLDGYFTHKRNLKRYGPILNDLIPRKRYQYAELEHMLKQKQAGEIHEKS